MKIHEIKALKGPNYWSNNRHQLIVMKLDIEEMEQYPSNTINGFNESLEALIPSLQHHRCSKGYEGGFIERLKEGTWMGHVIEHVALEIQYLAGMNCGYGRTRSTNEEGVYNVVFSYEIESAGLYAAEAAVRIVEKLISTQPYNIEQDIAVLKDIKARKGFGPSTQSIINEAKKRGIPVRSMDAGSLVMLGQGINQKLIRASMTSLTSNWGVETACDKEDTKSILAKAYISVPTGQVLNNEEHIKEIIDEIGFPVVVKPIDGNHGRGITINIKNYEQALQAFHLAKTISNDIIIEKYVEGYDFRFLLINYKLVAVAKRTPAMVIGDGYLTIEQLIDQTNADPDRGEGHEKCLTTIKIDKATETILKEKGMHLNDVLPMGQVLFLKETANISTGGTSTDVTDLVHPENLFIAERIARLLCLDICGIDVMAKDISLPLTKDANGFVIEVNACPGLRMHLQPSRGMARNVAEPIVDMLFPKNKPARIPIIAVTGTNGKTTTTRLAAHIAKTAGYKVGYTTTDGIYIDEYLIHKGDCTGYESASVILKDPTVDFAVLECARGGLLGSGLGFDHCDISIITNVSEDHLGLKGIQTLEDMANVKAVVAKSTFNHGYSVLNADDDLVFAMRKELDCKIALFSIDPQNKRVKQHTKNGGLAATIEKGYLIVCKGEWKVRICKMESIPLSFNGKAQCMVRNILAATLAATIQNFKVEHIRQALISFYPSPEKTPGRMNVFKFHNFNFMIDYAHNPGGFEELKYFLDRISASYKVGIIAGVGDRRDQDIIAVGNLAAKMYNEIIIRHDKDMRGRTEYELTELLLRGIQQHNKDVPVHVISDELEAMAYAIENARLGAFIVLSTDEIEESINFLNEQLQLEKREIPLKKKVI